MINLVAQNIAIPFSWWWYHGLQGILMMVADLVVIGTAFENNIHFLIRINTKI
jgi:hypothetical protein